MSNELVVSGGDGAVVPSTETAVGEHVGDASRDTAPLHAPSFDWSPRDPATVSDLRRQILRDLIIDGISEREIELCLPVLEDYAPAIRAAFKTFNRQELARLGDSVREELIRKGLITLEQIDRIRPILQRYSQESERALIGSGGSDVEVLARITQIEALMGNPHSSYYRGPDAIALQQEYLQLIERAQHNRRQ
jgi:hypothetical protein